MSNFVKYRGIQILTDATAGASLYPLSVNSLPNECCGARRCGDELVEYSRYSGDKRDYGDPKYWTPTLGIRVFPGKVTGLPSFPGEQVFEIPFGKDILTVGCVTTMVELSDICEKDTSGTGYHERASKTKISLEVGKNKVDVLFPYFAKLEGPGYTDSYLKDYYPRAAKKYRDLWSKKYSPIKDAIAAGGGAFFIITHDRVNTFLKALEEEKLTDFIVFEQRNIINLNYAPSENPRLNVFILKGKV